MSIIAVSNASFGYNGVDVFSDISFSVQEGELFCLLGPNGCGKTTLLDCILGTLKLKSGRVVINGQDSRTLRPGQAARHIAYVPQNHERTFPYTVLDIVKMGRASHTGLFSTPSRADTRLAKTVLGDMGIDHLQDRPYTQLSGGESQLVLIARALVQQTPIIIMDEPTVHLDFRHELKILETVVRLVRENGITVLMATHFPNHALYFQNNAVRTTVAMLSMKKFLDIGTPGDVVCNERLRELYGVNTCLVDYRCGNRTQKQVIPISTLE
jgi:iron complex transport system ATP-binding protein